MRVAQFLISAVALVASLTAAQMPAHEEKIKSDLRNAIKADPQVEADIMVQLESPEELTRRACQDDASLSRAQKTTCMVDNMQQFADQSQQQVKDLLQDFAGEFTDSTFFWINNSVSVKKARGTLVLALSGLESVVEIHPEQIFHTMHSGGGGKTEEKKHKTFGFGTLG